MDSEPENTGIKGLTAGELVDKFKDFLEKNYYAEISEKTRKGEKSLLLDFSELTHFDPGIADYLLDQPEECLKAAEAAIAMMETQGDAKGFTVRVNKLPESHRLMIRNVRSMHLNKFFFTEGVVRQKSDVRPQVTAAKFECPSCGNALHVLQLDTKFKEPTRCSCGRKGKFRLLSKELVDAQGLTLEEVPEQLEGGEQPKRMKVFLKNDLVSPLSEKKTNPGSKIVVTGVIKEIPIITRSGVQSTNFDLLLEANNVETIEEDFNDIKISPEEEKKIKDLSQDPNLLKKLVSSAAPSIYGHEKIKESLLMQLVGGVRKKRDDGVITRGDIHVLLVGDPGAAKSQMLKRMLLVAPKARYVTGKGASGAGLSATVVKDEFLQGWSLEAGALVLANKGLCCTTGDSEFILENGKRMTFEKLFRNKKTKIIKPKFKIFALDNNTLKITPHKIKQAIKIKNNKKILQIHTRTGREINLTEDNEVLTIKNSRMLWTQIHQLKINDFIAVPKKITINTKDNINSDFAYISGLIATDGHISINERHANTFFYNTNLHLIDTFENKMSSLNFSYSSTKQIKGRKSIINGKECISKKDILIIYNSRKEFAKKLIEFGIPSGNKSIKNQLNKKIVEYSDKTLCAFMRGIFDGDGSIRQNPEEITLTTGILENARLFQEILLRLGIISSVERSTRSWHCTVRGTTNCLLWVEKIGTNHPEKQDKFLKINLTQQKDRIDILPNYQEFFKKIINKNKGKLGKDVFKYFWNYSRPNVAPSKHKLKELNLFLNDLHLNKHIESDILWDKIVSIKYADSEFVYDFTMKKTNNFVANGTIMHNCIDEMDKMAKEDTSAMHEALEQQSVTISKANIQATLRCETTVLAAANPKFGRFDPYETVANQINLPPTLINRFDLIFTIKDIPDQAKDEKMAKFILQLHKNNTENPEIDTKLLKKYIAYARQNCKPKLTDAAIEELQEYYIKMRSSSAGAGVKSVPISARQLEGLVRLSEASAKIRLSDKVLKRDSKKAIELMDYCLRQVAFDEKTGTMDIDRIATEMPASQRNKIIVVKEIIADLENKIGKTIPIEDIIKIASEKGLGESEVDEVMQKLKKAGDIFEPRQGFISRI